MAIEEHSLEQFWTVKDIPSTDEQAADFEAAKLAKVSQPRADKKRSAKTAALSSLSKIATPQASAVPSHGVTSAPKPLRTAPPKIDEVPGPKLNGARQALAAPPLAPLFDLSTICTSAPRKAPSRTRPRPFGLEHCPIFYPTIEEFMKPMEYIERVSKEVSVKCGIVKIVPPEGWRPPFCLDTRSFRFRTRLQRLNSMEAAARANVNFLEQLYLFHRQQSDTRIQVPIVNNKPVDLWRLRREVNRLGGPTAVTDSRQWPQVAKAMSFDLSVATQLREAFIGIILPFDEYLKKAKASSKAPSTSGAVRTNTRMGTSRPLESPAESMTPAADEAVMDVVDSPPEFQRLSPAAALEFAVEPLATDEARMLIEPGDACEVCRWDHDHASMLLCDGCDRAYHLSCLTPPLEVIPKGQWICDNCIVSTGGDYGFEEGDEHTLHSYKRRADAFKAMWLDQHPPPPYVHREKSSPTIQPSSSVLRMAPWIKASPPPKLARPKVEDDGTPSTSRRTTPPNDDASTHHSAVGLSWEEKVHIEDHMEREFWRLVESQHETVEVEYGADLHSTKYGSAFPALESHPTEPYARDGWNLNNLPVMAGSLLRFVKSDISGMTNPWLYVGMAFSTFAWHKEDHYTYSINYNHMGDTKTWYGVSAADDEKLEAAMKRAAPELFEQQPDLMFQLVTLMSPGRLKRQGVGVTACDQRPGEFVLTFPKAYHAGFNHGVNLCEAVNFCLPDWLPHGLECVRHYQKFMKHPVFSHDELLVTVYAYEKGPIPSRWLYPHFKDMIEREIQDRDRIRHFYPQIDEVVEHSDKQTEEQYQCGTCNAFIYLSQVVNSDGRLACALHFEDLGPGSKLLKLRFDDEELTQMLLRVKARADKGGPRTSSLLGAPDADEPEQRKSGRKRIASAALREALGEDAPFAADRAKRARSSMPPGVGFREELASDEALEEDDPPEFEMMVDSAAHSSSPPVTGAPEPMDLMIIDPSLQ